MGLQFIIFILLERKYIVLFYLKVLNEEKAIQYLYSKYYWRVRLLLWYMWVC